MYSLDVRKIILRLYDKMKSLRYVETLTNVSRSTISRWKNLLEKDKGKKENSNTPVIIDTIKLIYSINPFYTILDVQKYLKNKHRLLLSINSMYNEI